MPPADTTTILPVATLPDRDAPSRAWLDARVLALVEDAEDGLDPEENLILYGLDSIRVMTFAAELKQRGIALTFEELARNPTANAWWALIEAKRVAG